MNSRKRRRNKFEAFDYDYQNLESFQDLINYLYERFPNGQLSEDIVNRIVVTENQRKELVKNSYLFRETTSNCDERKYSYSLGPNSLSLVSTWKTEELTKKIHNLTWVIVGLTVLNVCLFGFQIVNEVFL
ncbi:MAG: hypothetical protein ACOCQ4_00365 [bacterium]